ncbi:MAG: molybdopterin-dependent oxidoreductase [Rubrobacteraceae bacterium]
MGVRSRAFIAGAVGAVLAFGIAELVHGLYRLVPSVFVSLAQTIVRLTPGSLVTQGIELLGKADIPVLVACLVVGALVVAGLLAYLGTRFPFAALAAVGVLGAIAIFATLSEPFVDPLATVVTIVGALAAGTATSGFLLHSSALPGATSAAPGGVPEREERQPFGGVRSREAHSEGGVVVDRRNFLALSGGAAVAGLAAAGAGRLLAGGGTEGAASAPKQLSGTSGGGASGRTAGGGGKKTLPPPPKAASIEVEGMPPVITPNKDFYLIDTALTSPKIDVDQWTLKVKGAGIREPLEMSFKDLTSMPTREADVTLSCVSNEVGGGLISNARWTGVLLSDVLKEAGMSPNKINKASEQLVGRSVDGWTGGFKTKLAFDGREALVAFGMNDSELPVDHGFPVRLVIPGLYGYVSATKWLTEIELTDWDFDAYWIQRTWSKEGPIKTQSRIDTVKDKENLEAGTVPVGGVAWAPHRGISKVEVSTDDGETWNKARLAEQLSSDTWRQYVYEWDAKPGEHTLQVRATDGDGKTQTSKKTPPHPGGATGYHTVNVTVA